MIGGINPCAMLPRLVARTVFRRTVSPPSQAHDNPLRRVELFNSRALSVVAARSAYQESVVTNVVDGKPVAAHIYEYTTESTSHDA